MGLAVALLAVSFLTQRYVFSKERSEGRASLVGGRRGARRLAPPRPTAFRFSRPIEGASGWTRLDLPDDVLDACRPGLPDLRIEAEREGRAICARRRRGAAGPEMPLS